VLGVWPLHGLAVHGVELPRDIRPQGIGRHRHVSFAAQLIGTLMGVGIAQVGGFVVYGLLQEVGGIRLDAERNSTVRTSAFTNLRHAGGEV